MFQINLIGGEGCSSIQEPAQSKLHHTVFNMDCGQMSLSNEIL